MVRVETKGSKNNWTVELIDICGALYSFTFLLQVCSLVSKFGIITTSHFMYVGYVAALTEFLMFHESENAWFASVIKVITFQITNAGR